MAMYATVAELASYLRTTVQNSPATLAITTASGLFELESGTKFSSTSATYQVEGRGQPVISIPRGPLIAVVQVRIAGAVVASTEYTVVGANLYRVIGWGRILGPTLATAPFVSWPPDLVEVDYTYGYTTVPDDVKGAVLETAAVIYNNPDPSATQEQIDDYVLKSDGGGVRLAPGAALVASRYRRAGFA